MNNTVYPESHDKIDLSVKNMFLIHDLLIIPIKKDDLNKNVSQLIELYKNDEHVDDIDEKNLESETIDKIIKNIDMRKLSTNVNVIKGVSTDGKTGPVNDYLAKHEKRLFKGPYEIPQEMCELYVIEYIELGCLVSIVFLEIKNVDLLSYETINNKNEYTIIMDCMQWHPIKMDCSEMDDETKYLTYYLKKLMARIEEPDTLMDSNVICNTGFLRLKELPFKNDLNTKPFNYQLNNINWMIDYEKKPIADKYIVEDCLVFIPNGTVWNYDHNRFMDDNDHPIEIRGGIIMDEVGIGKSFQTLCLAYSTPDKNTLIVVPDHLIAHWESELIKHFVIKASFITIITKSQYKYYRGKYDRLIIDEIHEWYVEKCPDDKDSDTELFRKAICDDCKHKWGITATPFIVEQGLLHIIRYLTCQKNDRHDYLSFQFNQMDFDTSSLVLAGHLQYIYKQIFKRNTKKNIENELILPEIIQNNIMVEFNDLERMTYDAESSSTKNEDDLRKFCCDMSLKFAKNSANMTMEEFSQQVINMFINKYNAALEIAEALKIRLENEQYGFHSYTRIQYINKMNEVNNLGETINNLRRRMSDLFSCHICTCSVDMALPFTVISSCNHVFCTDCIKAWMCDSTRCPTCMKPFTGMDLCMVNSGVVDKQQEKQSKYSMYSSKIKALLEYLEKCEGKVIIYTQYDDFIEKIMTILKSQNISSLKFVNSDNIESFKNGDFKVMFLSSITNSSGIDLSFVSNVIIMEPIKSAKYKYVVDIEKQIIGRVMRIGQKNTVNVVRLIIKDTIEEKIYNECNAI